QSVLSTRPTLFPYTTLFRSRYAAVVVADSQRHAAEEFEGLLVAFLKGFGALSRIRLDENGVRIGKRHDEQRDLGAFAGQVDLRRSEEHTSELQSRENLVCRL